jgi:hypothetical protein
VFRITFACRCSCNHKRDALDQDAPHDSSVARLDERDATERNAVLVHPPAHDPEVAPLHLVHELRDLRDANLQLEKVVQTAQVPNRTHSRQRKSSADRQIAVCQNRVWRDPAAKTDGRSSFD